MCANTRAYMYGHCACTHMHVWILRVCVHVCTCRYMHGHCGRCLSWIFTTNSWEWGYYVHFTYVQSEVQRGVGEVSQARAQTAEEEDWDWNPDLQPGAALSTHSSACRLHTCSSQARWGGKGPIWSWWACSRTPENTLEAAEENLCLHHFLKYCFFFGNRRTRWDGQVCASDLSVFPSKLDLLTWCGFSSWKSHWPVNTQQSLSNKYILDGQVTVFTGFHADVGVILVGMNF